MTTVFVKTCLRDAKLASLQTRAANHFMRGVDKWIYCIEVQELEAFRRVLVEAPANVSFLTVEELFPKASEIELPYHRQQWCKINAPTHFGRHIQFDSDFIPCRPFDLDRWAEHPFWDYTVPNDNNKKMFKAGMDWLGFDFEYSFMCTPGWLHTTWLMTELHKKVPDLLGKFIEPKALISEYNMMGEVAFESEFREEYQWNLLRPYHTPNPLAQALYDANAQKHASDSDFMLCEQFAQGRPIYDIPRYRRRGIRP